MLDSRLTIEQRGGRAALSGELDITTVDQLAECLEQLAASPDGRFEIDLQGVTFMDSTALGTFGQRAAALRDRGSRLVLHGVTPHIRRLFEITNLQTLVDLAD